MAQKRKAIPLPDLRGKRVLDVGCDHGYWCKLASDAGAARVVGLDRNREVRGQGRVDLIALNNAKRWPRCEFEHFNLGKEWSSFGQFDVVFCFSMMHHAWANAQGDYERVWRWFREHTASDGVLMWEGPWDEQDGVARACAKLAGKPFKRDELIHYANVYFYVEALGPALHAAHRHVLRCAPRSIWKGTCASGAGGASAAFEYANGRRMAEIQHLIGVRPVPGSLNIRLTVPFDWNASHHRGTVQDVVQRGRGLNVPWAPREVGLWPVYINGVEAWAFRFTGEKYGDNFVELIAPYRLRERVNCDEKVVLCLR